MGNMNEPALNYQDELRKCKTMEDVLGKNGLMQKLLKDVIQNLLEAEMAEHLGRDKYERNDEPTENYRNGYNEKTIKNSLGEMDIDVPRDRKGEFDPIVVKKYQTTCSELDKKVIAMYAKGVTTRDIKAQLEELYGIDVSPSMISAITDKVMGAANDWQSRMLDRVYPIVYLDAIHYKVRTEGKIVNRAAYICLGINKEGMKDILSIWVGENEGAKFWLGVCNDLKNRGVEDILLACIDGLKGFPDAIKAVFPKTIIQTCIIHQIRNSLKYVGSKHQKEFMADLKPVYKAPTEEVALQELSGLEQKWGSKYPVVISSWYNNWENLCTYFKYPPEIRRMIYTTNTLEGFNRQLRKVTKTKSVFPTDDALKKSLYLATVDIMKKWSMPVANWAQTIAQFSIVFQGRLELDLG
jgi:transposase-like protein